MEIQDSQNRRLAIECEPFMGQRRNSVAELSEDDRQTVHEEWQI